MNKGKIKTFIIGVVVGSIAATVVPAMAERVTKTAELIYNGIKVVVDGKQADLKDANGNPVEPFIIDGTTYLPVRGVANAMNKAVSWDAATQTVYLGKNEEIQQPSVWLNDLETFTRTAFGESVDTLEFGGSEYNNILTANTGEVYKNYWYPDGSTSYNLAYKYSRFKGTFYLSKGGKDYDVSQRMLVYGDDRLIYSSEGLTSGDKPINFDIDVSNVSVMKIVYQYNYADETGDWNELFEDYFYGGYGDYRIAYHTPIGNAGLYE